MQGKNEGSTLYASPPAMSTPRANLLGMPTELRLAFYDRVSEPLVNEDPEYHRRYDRPSDMLPSKMQAYLSLIRICKTISGEASEHFLRYYVPRLSFRFSDPLELRKYIIRTLIRHPQVLRSIRFSIHSGMLGGNATSAFRTCSLANMRWHNVCFNYKQRGHEYQEVDRTTYAHDGNEMHFCRLVGATPFLVSLHQIGDDRTARYLDMTGKVSDLDWSRVPEWSDGRSRREPSVAWC